MLWILQLSWPYPWWQKQMCCTHPRSVSHSRKKNHEKPVGSWARTGSVRFDVIKSRVPDTFFRENIYNITTAAFTQEYNRWIYIYIYILSRASLAFGDGFFLLKVYIYIPVYTSHIWVALCLYRHSFLSFSGQKCLREWRFIILFFLKEEYYTAIS